MDLITMNILESTMVSICREMGITLMKTSYSTIFNEALDFTCGLANAEGEMIAVADYCPSQIGGMPLLVQSCLKELDMDDLAPGDVILHNDPYRGGLHTPEHTFFKPIFVDAELVGWAVAIGHIAEVGGMAPGGFCGEATDIFQEGIRIPPVKLKTKGKDNRDIWKLLLANVRTPRTNYGDLRALIAAVDLGEQQMQGVFEKYGKERVRQNVSDLLLYSERRMRAELEAIPDGIYTFVDHIESDGIDADRTYDVHVAVHKMGQDIVVDYTGSSPQASGPINATLGVSTSAAYNAILHMTDPSIPRNSGCFRPIRIVAPGGTIVNVDFPAPEVGGNTETHPRIVGAILGAMAGAVPNRVMAAEGATHCNFVFGGVDADSGEYFACYDLEAVGWGGRAFADGNDAVDSINGNCRITPVEVYETRFPWRVEKLAFNRDSGGAGEYRGGVGYSKQMLCLNETITVSQMTDRHHFAPWGLKGGGEGGLGATLVQKAGTTGWKTMCDAYGKASSSRYSNVQIRRGDRITLTTPGGGGYGDPMKRAPQALRDDVLDGYVSVQAARESYGYKEEA
ncbi:hydantoinase B/oxoprolinase family protein [Paraburkholderia silvatlantica]|uniref:N-methylhydantoinase B n=1 Tax=Paraburkholderia silvatlantica TaxID=321895 RepID=A0A2U0ZTQ5_9BURK|nr:hydantoinase B/oxoprolinase family protein [Paraburkholderia silvatlantica]MBB2932596.1 N-methylhydantoinase B/oxoprolinase/acetone carboxylase alpha subunit [Paraburkholderia silvatlantica]PVY22279.1 N-methylhydantoinase B [Paraburkholderia silvatlantica]PXW27086.1 N-methylhydantoinase B [Paraburkholderia silvatlantica]PYE21539.1 N-methylhydantoinase B [Paraburkholderia silvatlantica]